MIEYLAYTLRPGLLAAVIFLAQLLLLAIGYALAKYRHFGEPDKSSEIIRTAIFATTAFMLGFAFSLSSARFDDRRTLLRREVISIGTTDLRATYLPPRESKAFRSALADYAQTRLDSYLLDVGTREHTQALARSDDLVRRMWSMASSAGHANQSSIQLGLFTQSLNEAIDLGGTQDIALRSHVPTEIYELLFLLMLITSFTAGLNLTRARRLDAVLTIGFVIIISALIFTIDDLDRPQKGLIRIDLSPLQQEIHELRGGSQELALPV